MGLEKLTEKETQFLEFEKQLLLPWSKYFLYGEFFIFLFLLFKGFGAYQLAIQSGKTPDSAFDLVMNSSNVSGAFWFLCMFITHLSQKAMAKRYIAIIDKLEK